MGGMHTGLGRRGVGSEEGFDFVGIDLDSCDVKTQAQSTRRANSRPKSRGQILASLRFIQMLFTTTLSCGRHQLEHKEQGEKERERRRCSADKVIEKDLELGPVELLHGHARLDGRLLRQERRGAFARRGRGPLALPRRGWWRRWPTRNDHLFAAFGAFAVRRCRELSRLQRKELLLLTFPPKIPIDQR